MRISYTPITIRKATKRDISEIVRLSEALCQEHADKDSYFQSSGGKAHEKYLKEDLPKAHSAYWVAKTDERTVAFGSCCVMDRKGFTHHQVGGIVDIYVEKEYRKLGIAKEILKNMGEWFAKKKVNFVEVTAATSNRMSTRFWKSLGFEGFMQTFKIQTPKKKALFAS